MSLSYSQYLNLLYCIQVYSTHGQIIASQESGAGWLLGADIIRDVVVVAHPQIGWLCRFGLCTLYRTPRDV